METFDQSKPFKRLDESKASFADLPRELRDQVYSHLWRATPHIQPSRWSAVVQNFVVSYEGAISKGWPLLGLPQWLLLSKGICHEGSNELLRRATWSCRLYEHHVSEGVNSPLIDASLATRVTLQADIFAVYEPQDQATSSQLYLYSSFPALISTPSRLGANMRHLTLELEVIFLELPIKTDTSWTLDLSPFDRLDLRLDSLVVISSSRDGQDLSAIAPAFLTAHKAEIDRLGKILVGQNGRLGAEHWITQPVPRWDWDVYLLKIVVRFCKDGT